MTANVEWAIYMLLLMAPVMCFCRGLFDLIADLIHKARDKPPRVAFSAGTESRS